MNLSHTKSLYSILLFTIFQFGFSQNDENRWRFSVGVNSIDLYPTGDTSAYLGNSGGLFEDFFNVGDHWNMGGPSVSISRYVAAGFSLGLQGGVNKIQKINGISDPLISTYSTDGFLSFSPINKGFIRPFLKAGFGLSSFDISGTMTEGRLLSKNISKTIHGGVGFDIMLDPAFAITLQTEYRNAFETFGTDYLQHQLGMTYQFGAKDTDKDGIPDKKDECPEVPGLKEYNGCPDTDGDTVIDKKDTCPEIPGKVEYNGCPDTDGDGVPDPDDACVDVPGSPEMNGCPDTDGDGVADDTDECIEEVGPQENNGCPWPDTDGDGVPDKDDACKDEAGSETNNGCPELSDEIMKTINEHGSKINFAANSAKILGKKMRTILLEIRDILVENPKGKLLIEGYSSSDGDEAYNAALSIRRAEAVRDLLITMDIEAERLEVKGLGETLPIGDNESQEGRAKNRRVQFTYKY